MKAKPKDYPNPFFSSTHPKESVRVILFLKTPTGKISKFYQSFLVKKMGRFSDFSKQKAIDYAEKECVKTAKIVFAKELKKGYKLDEDFLLPSIWN